MAEDGNVQNLPVLNRTSFHFQPQINWLNAPMYYKGFYHLFYQHNPLAPEFSRRIIWGHSVSQDMVNWIQLPPALSPSESYDINSCWSGSATILPDGKPVILYTGIDNQERREDRRQVTVLAVPKDASDPLLREWIKPKQNPVMDPSEDILHYCFRDPTTAWQGQDGKWRVLIGAKERDTLRGVALLYHSTDDCEQWTRYQEPLLVAQANEMLECVDFFPVKLMGKEGVDTSVNNASVRHVLKVSFEEELGGKDCYVIGSYCSETDRFVPDSELTYTRADLRYDDGWFYASKSFFDSAKNRRINWGWVVETDSREDDIEKGWAGLLGLPRQMWLDTSGKRLMQWPIQEINNLRTRQVSFHNRELEGRSMFEITGITAAQADVEVTFDLPVLEDNSRIRDATHVADAVLFNNGNSLGCVYGPFGLLALASNDLSEQTAIFFKIIRHGNGYSVIMGSDENRSSLRENVQKIPHGTFLDIDPRHEKISLRCLIDHSIIESYGAGGRNVITSRVYPKLAIGEAAKLYAFNNGTEGVTMSIKESSNMEAASWPLYYKGFYHLFYQHNPLNPFFGDIMVWGHSVSQDLVNWIKLEPALSPSVPSDINSFWSGSTTILPDGKPIILYTGNDANKHQVTVLAEPKDPSDPLLREWVKPEGNPVMVPLPPSNVPVHCFRDPTTAWQEHDGKWRALVGAKEKDIKKGMAVLYHSDDFVQWTKFPCLYLSHKSLECGSAWTFFLFRSLAFFDSAKNRRISWGWIMERDSNEDDIMKGWSGIMAIPREIWLEKSGKRLMQWPVEEINNLRAKNVSLDSKQLEGGSILEISGITASQADIEVAFDLPDLENDTDALDSEEVDQATLIDGYSASVKGVYGPFGLLALASNDLSEHTAIFLELFVVGMDMRSSLRDNIEKATLGTSLDIDPRHEKISLRCLIDHSVIESYGGGGRSVITSRFYPKMAIGEEARLYVFNHGTKAVTMSSLEAWSMRKAQINSNET
ncbi:unnamed protein product [Brassica napus]|uniref:(rape) hypothetical protein n=2 Tax=Brassica napus TaxID=3708 RepID=A0A816V3A3_BRANA|nr:unnamed protein product [Brassica napus]